MRSRGKPNKKWQISATNGTGKYLFPILSRQTIAWTLDLKFSDSNESMTQSSIRWSDRFMDRTDRYVGCGMSLMWTDCLCPTMHNNRPSTRTCMYPIRVWTYRFSSFEGGFPASASPAGTERESPGAPPPAAELLRRVTDQTLSIRLHDFDQLNVSNWGTSLLGVRYLLPCYL